MVERPGRSHVHPDGESPRPAAAEPDRLSDDPVVSFSLAPEPAEDRVELLTGREREILDMITRGLTNKEIAARLSISEHTVKTHARSIRRKLHVSNRVQAALIYRHHSG